MLQTTDNFGGGKLGTLGGGGGLWMPGGGVGVGGGGGEGLGGEVPLGDRGLMEQDLCRRL